MDAIVGWITRVSLILLGGGLVVIVAVLLAWPVFFPIIKAYEGLLRRKDLRSTTRGANAAIAVALARDLERKRGSMKKKR
jgi:hypothetical protein